MRSHTLGGTSMSSSTPHRVWIIIHQVPNIRSRHVNDSRCVAQKRLCSTVHGDERQRGSTRCHCPRMLLADLVPSSPDAICHLASPALQVDAPLPRPKSANAGKWKTTFKQLNMSMDGLTKKDLCTPLLDLR